MQHKRNILAGMTDYTGVSLEDILSDFSDWLQHTSETVERLEKYALKVEENKALIENPREVSSFIEFFLNLFSRYRSDLQTLVDELPEGAVEAHIAMVKQLYESSKLAEEYTIRFKNEWLCKSLPHEEIRNLLDAVYGDTRDMLIDYRDLSNVIPRLRVFLHRPSNSIEVLKYLQLKPNFHGIGIDLNRVLGRFKRWFQKKRL